MKRRTFLKKTGAGAVCACLGCAGFAEAIEEPQKYEKDYRIEGNVLIINVKDYRKLNDVGDSDTIKVDKTKVIVIHPAENLYKAFRNKCTHKGGRVVYKRWDDYMQCTRHSSRFDISGKVIRGPAQLPLTEYKTTLDNDQLSIFLETQKEEK
jgi:cytochrome b6-f complex iron-sulfur subunit